MLRDPQQLGIVGLQHRDQILNRQGRYKVIAGNAPHRSIRLIPHQHGAHPVRLAFQRDHAMPQMNFTAARAYTPRDLFPHLAGTELGVQESLDQARLGLLLRRVCA